MENEFNGRMSNLTDKELFDILKDKESYQALAFNSAINELNNRGFSEKTAPVLKEYNEFILKQKLEVERQQALPELYSQKSIILFSAFFTAICGAIMMAYNFKKLGNQEKSKSVLIFGFVYALIFIFFLILTDVNIIKLLLQIGALIGGLVLFFRFEKFYPSELEYKNKPIWKILIYALVISISLFIIQYVFILN